MFYPSLIPYVLIADAFSFGLERIAGTMHRKKIALITNRKDDILVITAIYLAMHFKRNIDTFQLKAGYCHIPAKSWVMVGYIIGFDKP